MFWTADSFLWFAQLAQAFWQKIPATTCFPHFWPASKVCADADNCYPLLSLLLFLPQLEIRVLNRPAYRPARSVKLLRHHSQPNILPEVQACRQQQAACGQERLGRTGHPCCAIKAFSAFRHANVESPKQREDIHQMSSRQWGVHCHMGTVGHESCWLPALFFTQPVRGLSVEQHCSASDFLRYSSMRRHCNFVMRIGKLIACRQEAWDLNSACHKSANLKFCCRVAMGSFDESSVSVLP